MSQNQDQISHLRALAPASALSETVTVISTQFVRGTDGESDRSITSKDTHTITPFTYRTLFKVLAHVNTIFTAIAGRAIDFDDPLALAQLIMHATAEAGDSVQAVISLAIGKPVEYLDTIMPDDGLNLTAAVVRVNKDFFVQRILPMIATLRTEATELVTAVGETS